MTLVIRLFEKNLRDDYEALARILSTVRPNVPVTATELRHADETWPEYCVMHCLLGEIDGAPVASGRISHSAFSFHPKRMVITVSVVPAARHRGIGASIYGRLLQFTEQHDLRSLRTIVQEEDSDGLNFAVKRGYVEVMREWDSVLDLAAFDPSRFAHLTDKAADRGIKIRSLREIRDFGRLDWAERAYETEMTTLVDVPFAEPFTPPSFEHWRKSVLESPNFLPEGFFIALDGDRFVGTSALWRRQADSVLETGLTGVLREYRRQGIAIALKLRALGYAKENGVRQVRTENATTNRPMLSINELLGFVKEPAHIQMIKKLRDE